MNLPLALYVHFPWCVRKCPYCDFNSHAVQGELPESRYVDVLCAELALQVEHFGLARREVVSVFMGGGTPSLFSPDAIARVLTRARGLLRFAHDVEITMEANPGTIERGRFAEYRAAGVTRVSLGAQTFGAAQLGVLGRIHAADDTRRAAEELHAAGLDNFNLDLMYALPSQTIDAALADVDEALKLSPRHVSHYQLTLEPGTVFGGRPPPGLPAEEDAGRMLDECGARLTAAGFARYEVSAYAQPGWECRHNLNYWNFGDYVGIGAGSHGKITQLDHMTGFVNMLTRTQQVREPRRYLAAMPALPTAAPVASADRPFEFMMNALRLKNGFAIADFERRTGLSWRAAEPQVAQLVRRGLLEADGWRCRPTARGLDLLNEVLLTFLPEGGSRAAPYAQERPPGLK